MALILVTGGARSGKSRLAMDLARQRRRPVVFVATGEPLDEEMRERIRRHRAARPDSWTTLEAPIDLEEAVRAAAPDAVVIVDCLSVWVANLMGRELADDDILVRSRRAAAAAAARGAGSVAVTNEVGSGIVPDHPLGRRYRDVLGLVNADWAAAASRVGLVVAGRLLPLTTLEETWNDNVWNDNVGNDEGRRLHEWNDQGWTTG